MPSPVIFNLGCLELRWYGACAALAMLAGYLVAVWRSRRFGLNHNDVADLIMVCVVAGLAGARLEYVRRFWNDYFAGDFWGIFRIWEGGLVFQGGFILALAVVCAMCWKRHWRLGDVGDLLAPVIPVGHAIARVGCLLNGCCFGRPWSGWLAIRYPDEGNDVLGSQIANGSLEPGATENLPVFPVQLLEALCCVVIAVVILFLERRKMCRGQLFTVYMLGYAIVRFAVEFFRGDYHQQGGLTPAQIICIAIILPLAAGVIAVSAWCRKRGRKA